MTCWHHGCCSHPLRKTAVKPLYAAYIKKALAKSLVISNQKVPDFPSRTGFCSWDDSQSPYRHLCPWVAVKGIRQSPTHTFCRMCPQHTFSLSHSEIGASRPLTVPGQFQDKLSRVNSDQCWVHHSLLAVVWVLQQMCPDRRWLSWEVNTFLTLIVVFSLNYSSLIFDSLIQIF